MFAVPVDGKKLPAVAVTSGRPGSVAVTRGYPFSTHIDELVLRNCTRVSWWPPAPFRSPGVTATSVAVQARASVAGGVVAGVVGGWYGGSGASVQGTVPVRSTVGV